MKLNVKPRSADKKRESKRIRREGGIPAVVYGKNFKEETIIVQEDEFKTALRNTPKGGLPTVIFNIADDKGKSRDAIVKDIQYHPTTYDILHLDFEVLQKEISVNIKVPVEFTGVADCVGIKQGGVLRQVIRHVKVNCLPKDIPTQFQLNVRNLSINQYLKLSDIEMPKGVKPLVDTSEVVVVIAKK